MTWNFTCTGGRKLSTNEYSVVESVVWAGFLVLDISKYIFATTMQVGPGWWEVGDRESYWDKIVIDQLYLWICDVFYICNSITERVWYTTECKGEDTGRSFKNLGQCWASFHISVGYLYAIHRKLTIQGVFSAHFLIGGYIFVVELYEFFTYFGYQPLIRDIVCKYLFVKIYTSLHSPQHNS